MLIGLPTLTTACSSDDDGGSSAEEPVAIAATIHIVDGEFDPRDLELEVGGTVQWINDDVNPHQLLSLDSDLLRSPVIAPGKAWTFQFTKAGEVPYYDAFRATMKGIITIQ